MFDNLDFAVHFCTTKNKDLNQFFIKKELKRGNQKTFKLLSDSDDLPAYNANYELYKNLYLNDDNQINKKQVWNILEFVDDSNLNNLSPKLKANSKDTLATNELRAIRRQMIDIKDKDEILSFLAPPIGKLNRIGSGFYFPVYKLKRVNNVNSLDHSDTIQFQLSVPKVLYGHNVAEFVPQYKSQRYSANRVGIIDQSDFLLKRAKEFIRTFLDEVCLRFGIAEQIPLHTVEIVRMDICYNSYFNTKQQALDFIDEAKHIPKPKEAKNQKVLANYFTTMYYVGKGWKLKIYHKGTEFTKSKNGVKSDYQRLIDINQQYIFKLYMKYKKKGIDTPNLDILKNNEVRLKHLFRLLAKDENFKLSTKSSETTHKISDLELLNIYGKIAPFNVHEIRKTADKIARFEIEFGRDKLTDIFNKKVFRKGCKIHKKYVKNYKKFKAIKARTKNLPSDKTAQQFINKEYDKIFRNKANVESFNNLEAFYNTKKRFWLELDLKKVHLTEWYHYGNKDVETFKYSEYSRNGKQIIANRKYGEYYNIQAGKNAFLTDSLFKEMLTFFNKQLLHFQVERLPEIEKLKKSVLIYNDDVEQQALKNYGKKYSKLKKECRETIDKKINLKNILPLIEYLHKGQTWRQIRDHFSISASTFYRYKKQLLKLGITEKSRPSIVAYSNSLDFSVFYSNTKSKPMKYFAGVISNNNKRIYPDLYTDSRVKNKA